MCHTRILSIQLHSKAPIRRTLMVACYAYTGNLEQAKRHADELSLFAPEFLSTILRGDMRLYKAQNHNTRLVEGLQKVGIRE